MKVQNILFEVIKADPRWKYRLEHKDAQLMKSLRYRGVLSPLILVQQQNKFCLVDGFKRYRFLLQEGVSTVPAMLYSGTQVEEAFFHGLILNETQRPLSVVEKSNVARIIHSFDLKEFQEKMFDFLNIPFNQRFIRRFLEINKLPLYAKNYFHEFQFSLRQIERILPVHISKLRSWIQLSHKLRLKAQEFVNLVEILTDISLREEIPVEDLYKKLRISDLMDKDWTPQQKSMHLKSHLHQIRYPLLSSIQQRVEEHITKLKHRSPLPLEILWDKTLERPGYSVMLYLEQEEKLKEFRNLSENPLFLQDLKKLFKILLNSLEEANETA